MHISESKNSQCPNTGSFAKLGNPRHRLACLPFTGSEACPFKLGLGLAPDPLTMPRVRPVSTGPGKCQSKRPSSED